VPSKPELPITLIVRRGALRRFHKLKKETADLPVVVTWDRRADDGRQSDGGEAAGPVDERRKQLSFTWEMADFLVVPGDAPGDE
jgi:hypothetical protein